jgi:hypothetical protein
VAKMARTSSPNSQKCASPFPRPWYSLSR